MYSKLVEDYIAKISPIPLDRELKKWRLEVLDGGTDIYYRNDVVMHTAKPATYELRENIIEISRILGRDIPQEYELRWTDDGDYKFKIPTRQY